MKFSFKKREPTPEELAQNVIKSTQRLRKAEDKYIKAKVALETLTVAESDKIFYKWFCRIGIPASIVLICISGRILWVLFVHPNKEARKLPELSFWLFACTFSLTLIASLVFLFSPSTWKSAKTSDTEEN